MKSEHEKIFTNIFESKRWGGELSESVSGPGSSLEQTIKIREELPFIFEKYNISTLLDLPCGDFHWMQHIIPNYINYVGGDVVIKVIDKNKNLYSDDKKKFKKINIMEDHIPKVDMVFCRDCLVHFSYNDTFRALENIYKSHSKFMVATTFPKRESNVNINTGNWRPINLSLEPFNLPEPVEIINEGLKGAYSDKSLGLWSLDCIRDSLKSKDI